MSDLYCCENNSGDEVTAYDDPILLCDQVLINLLKTEELYNLPSTQFDSVQKSVTLEMRQIVAEWMMEVCEEQQCNDSVFALAIYLMNRFLLTISIEKNQLQLLGTTCMLIASKLRESRPFAADTLVYYTDHSCKKEQLTSWELLVLSILKWDVAAITPHDFLKHIWKKLDIDTVDIKYEMVIKHAKTLITLCLRDFTFAKCLPSIIACASIASSLCGLKWVEKSKMSMDDLIQRLADITNIDKEFISQCYRQINEMIQESTSMCVDNATKMDDDCNHTLRPDEFTPPPSKNQEHETALTPTDVHDISFLIHKENNSEHY